MDYTIEDTGACKLIFESFDDDGDLAQEFVIHVEDIVWLCMIGQSCREGYERYRNKVLAGAKRFTVSPPPGRNQP